MEQIVLPNSITIEPTDTPNTGELVITPCHQGYGITLGNALRRVLLSSLPGAAVESVKIEGVQHEFSASDSVAEDLVEVTLNLKEMAVISHVEGPVTLTLSKKGKGEITAGDFDRNADIEIMNPKLKIMTVTDASREINMKVVIGNGRGYVPVSEKETMNLDLGTIVIDSLYTPIRDVGYKVENTRVGDVTDYEKLTLTIQTNGTITPEEAVKQTTKILMDHFALILDAQDAPADAPVAEVEEDEEVVEEEAVEEPAEETNEE